MGVISGDRPWTKILPTARGCGTAGVSGAAQGWAEPPLPHRAAPAPPLWVARVPSSSWSLSCASAGQGLPGNITHPTPTSHPALGQLAPHG